MTDDVEAVLARFFAAIEAGDFETVAELYHDELQVWHSVTDREQTKEENLRLLTWLRSAIDFRYELLEQIVSGTEVARRHVLHASVDGQELTVPAALFMTVEDGRIRRIAEHVDRTVTDQLLALVPRPG